MTMKKTAGLAITSFTILWALLPPPSLAQPQAGLSEHAITSAGAERSYLLYLPASYGREPIPLLIGLHPSGGTPRSLVNISGFDKLSDRYGFAAVFPAGVFTNSITARSWNANVDEGVDDVQFVRDVIEDVAGIVKIDRSRIYASGFSGGARMSSRLACELSDVLAAAAPVAGIQYPDDCTLSRPVPILTFHGKADASNHYELRKDSRPYWHMGVETAIDKWRQADDCTLSNEDDRLSQHVTFYQWSDCAGSSEIRFYLIDNGGHTWPGSKVMSENPDRVTNMDIDASELIWEFFSRHRLP
jgi:polyhydroxybutyrate depolymerase